MNIYDFNKICVVGWGISGISLCNLLLSLKKEVFVSESAERGSFDSCLVDSFLKKGVRFEFGGHSRNFIKDSQLLVLSPGVNTFNSEVLLSARELSLPYVGEIELACWLTEAKIVALTGTNGKTTTAYLTHKVLEQADNRVFLGGNIGTPLSSFVLDTKKEDIIVLEVSSFQLETILDFKPYVAGLLNIEPDHLDRYSDLKEYLRAKLNIFKNQRACDWALLNENIGFGSEIEKAIKAQKVYFSKEFPNENFSCIYRIASIFGLDRTACNRVFSEFKGLEHRLQFVKSLKGIDFINDSKATNPSSTIWALKNTKPPVILIAGGKDKGLDYTAITPYSACLKKVNLFGKSSLKIKKALGTGIKSELFPSLEAAVESSFKEAAEGDSVLFSPMCASFDMFDDYRHRGRRFMEIVSSLSR